MQVGELIARMEYEYGYRFQQGDVLLIGVNDQGMGGPQAVLPIEQATVEQQVQGIHEEVLPMVHRDYRNLIMVRYEEFDYHETNGFHDQFTASLDDHPGGFEVVAQYKVDQNRQLYQGYMDQQWASPGLRWTMPGKLPDVSAQMRELGYKEPASSEAEYLRSFQPHPEPGFQPLDQEQEVSHLNRLAPRVSVEVARHALATTASTESIEQQAKARQTLGHLVAYDEDARDAVAYDASISPAKKDALVETYRQAPAKQRPALAAAAGAAWMMSGGGLKAGRAIMAHAYQSTRPSDRALVTAAEVATTRAHMRPEEIQEAFGKEIGTDLEAAEAAHQEWERLYSSTTTQTETETVVETETVEEPDQMQLALEHQMNQPPAPVASSGPEVD
ncbi:hypothetical protein [Nesterenkonia alkaliphila]|uniref:DUF4192 family protein n=1 Tax=Nesterenkonia alkaliphila TaxID=1463631 RepID=A0A7K1UH67_9MICC|nr:hypothetical protein [Nesterenkonia alkaliphila]MVT25736.1 hypothetical protein [Nesterenkonia alkaliphila]GFZ85444.1 hypothetical protein GCM10011359_13230 [Nesterenkonia alkaliphila]